MILITNFPQFKFLLIPLLSDLTMIQTEPQAFQVIFIIEEHFFLKIK